MKGVLSSRSAGKVKSTVLPAGNFLLFTGFKCWNVDPSVRPMALQDSVEDLELPQSIDELRILRRRAWCADRSVEAPKHLLECIVVTFAVAAGQIGIAACCGLE